MPPRRTRATKKADDHQDTPDEVKVVESCSTAPLSATDEKQQETTSSDASTMTATRSKGKSRAARHQPLLSETAAPSSSEAVSSNPEAAEPSSPPPSSSSSKPTITMEDRQARLSALRAKMASSTKANRKAILSEQSRSRTIASELKSSSASRKIQKAEQILEERDLRESGQDVERYRNMHYSLEDSEAWDAKIEEKERRKDRGPGDFGDAAERAYQRQVRMLKPDVAAYRQSKSESEALKANSPASSALIKVKGKGKDETQSDELHYGTHKPSDDAIDRVVNHLNHQRQIIQNRSRRRHDDPDAEVNYINDSNRHFNKKLKRFYDKQTQEIRENLERGTAL
ncbi:related to SYF2 - pre-mRNA-splicing factor [Ustilago trichophora]|uniref:Pre-mRNA-splicing factor SYF2 n=1 Tax=Ustilago trichophora TaxID=86804 RepID=A0A5C3DUA5_9BASI|nr:related to SYF2 - pre-mRNA-splicing factor [Ustilago trichophora]